MREDTAELDTLCDALVLIESALLVDGVSMIAYPTGSSGADCESATITMRGSYLKEVGKAILSYGIVVVRNPGMIVRINDLCLVAPDEKWPTVLIDCLARLRVAIRTSQQKPGTVWRCKDGIAWGMWQWKDGDYSGHWRRVSIDYLVVENTKRVGKRERDAQCWARGARRKGGNYR